MNMKVRGWDTRSNYIAIEKSYSKVCRSFPVVLMSVHHTPKLHIRCDIILNATRTLHSYLHSMNLNFLWVASFVITGINSLVFGSPTTASNKSFSFKNVCTMLRTGVTLKNYLMGVSERSLKSL